jgi:hypothetical protein
MFSVIFGGMRSPSCAGAGPSAPIPLIRDQPCAAAAIAARVKATEAIRLRR